MLRKSPLHGASPGAAGTSQYPLARRIGGGGPSCCGARTAVADRYLSREAPRLPLPELQVPASCSCSYKHHVDRRASAS